MYKLIKQFIGFISVSGIGFIIDFTCYTILTNVFNMNVFASNFLSAIPAVTFVFFVSTRYVFGNNLKTTEKLVRYIIYVLYQIVLLYCVSKLSQMIYDYEEISFLVHMNKQVKKILVKLCITPITMTINFIFMKVIVEFLSKEKQNENSSLYTKL
ncbi:MAG: GtrA family protein [Vallitalea sp.]|jgi:putative flippase GtrA|nr:GtrA family protein [Vallitalea sp.]